VLVVGALINISSWPWYTIFNYKQQRRRRFECYA